MSSIHSRKKEEEKIEGQKEDRREGKRDRKTET